VRTYTQVAHGIAQWNWVYNNAGTWSQSSGNVFTTHPVGLVIATTTDTLTICFYGVVNRPSHGLTVGVWYYATTSGSIVTAPTDKWVYPLLFILDADNILVAPKREQPKRIAAQSPATDQDDYAPSNATVWKECTVFRVNPTAAVEITGFAAQADQRYPLWKDIFNISQTYSVTFPNQDTGSAAANRIITPNGDPFILRPLCGARIFYDITSERWRIWGNGLVTDTHYEGAGGTLDGKYHNGKPTYIKSISGSSLSDEASIVNSGVDEFVDEWGWVEATSGIQVKVGFNNGTDIAYCKKTTGNAITVNVAGAFLNEPYSITARFTKS
jgi:hypothetical protein